ncbi:MAG: TIGR04076 family protein [Spirochaetaceae bacterium]|nr:MAG: TIGR04076 family protein [Spirochaetaceae bacterium]
MEEIKGIHKVRIVVTEIQQKGVCPRGIEVGDEFMYEGDNLPELPCPDALYTLWPWMAALRYGGSNPWETESNGFRGFFRVCCQDPDNPVAFKLIRIDE